LVRRALPIHNTAATIRTGRCREHSKREEKEKMKTGMRGCGMKEEIIREGRMI
jgi:hypothetical protein